MAEKIRPRPPEGTHVPDTRPTFKPAPTIERPAPSLNEHHQEPPPQGLLTVPQPRPSREAPLDRPSLGSGARAEARESRELPKPGLGIETFEMEDFLDKPVESKPALPPQRQPLEELIERETIGRGNHFSEHAMSTILRDPAVSDAQLKAKEQRQQAEKATKSLDSKSTELAQAKNELAEIDRRIPSDSKLPAAQSDYGEALGELSKFYLVRSMEPEQRQAETEFIESRLQKLTDQLNASTTSPDQKQAIIKEIGDLENWMKSLLADPYDDTPIDPARAMQMMQMIMLAQIAAGIPLSGEAEGALEEEQPMHLQAEPQPRSPEDDAAYELAGEKLATLRDQLFANSSQLFGADQAEGSAQLGQTLQDKMKYNPDASNVKAPETLAALQSRAQILEEYVGSLKEALRTAPAEERSDLAGELATYSHELSLLNTVAEKKSTLDTIASQTDRALLAQRGDAMQRVQSLEGQVEQASVNQDKQMRLQNLRDYQTLSTTLTSLTDQIRTLTKRAKADKAYLENKEVKLPKAKQEAIDRLADAEKKLQELDPAFMATMHQLEVFENQKRIERKGADPYPETASIEGITKWAQGLVTTTGDEMPSKAELMRQYQLAKNGLDGITGAYADAAKNVASRVYEAATAKDASSLVANLSLDQLTSLMGDFRDFSMKNPILARELAANLMHTYAILAADGSSATSQLLSSARGILQRRTAENIATDMLLGTREHLYSTEVPQVLSPDQLAFIDLAERAPYLAAAYIGAQGKNLGGSWAQTVASFIPWVGTNRVVQAMAGASGGAAEVKAQKMAAEKISRDQEVIANSLLSGFNALGKGEGVSGAIKAAATYGLVRQTLQMAGTMARDVHESGSVGGTIASYLKSYGRRWTESPGSETAKVGTATVIGAGVATGTGIAVVGATSIAAAPIAAAVLAGFGATIATRAAYTKIADWWNPERATMRQLQESKERLEKAAQRLPSIYQDSLVSQGHASAEDAQRASSVVSAAVKRLNPKVFEEAAKITGKTPQEQQEAQSAFILEAVNKEVEQQRQTELAAASKKVEPDPQIEALNKRLSSIDERTSQPEIRRQLDEMQRSLPPGEAADTVEAQLRDNIAALRNGRANITMEQIDAIRTEIATMRIRQVESAALEDPNLQAKLIASGGTSSTPTTKAGSLATGGKTRV